MWVGGKEGIGRERGYIAPRMDHSVYELPQSLSRFQRFSPPFCFFPFQSFPWEGTCIATNSLSPSFRCILKRKHIFSLFSFSTFRRFLDLAGRMRKLFAEDMGRPPRMQRLLGLTFFFSGASPSKPKACTFMKRFTSYKR